MAVYAIGDLHGCYRPFRSLLETIGFNFSFDKLWFVGDLINRGPQSLECIREIKGLGDRAVTVLGNHDLSFLATAAGEDPLARCNPTLRPILEAPDCEELLAWLSSRPLAHYDADLDWLMVHAGVAPSWTVEQTLSLADEVSKTLQGPRSKSALAAMYGDHPSQWSDTLRGDNRTRCIINYLTRIRMCAANGDLLMTHKGPAESDTGKNPWFEFPRPTSDTRIVFGHWSALQAVHWPDHNVWCLDTGCAWGGQLTALQLDSPQLDLTQVPAQTD